MLTLSGYHLDEKLYESDRSLVYRAQRREDGCAVVLKILKGSYPSPERLAWFKREYELTCHLNLAGLVRAYRLELDQPHWIMVLEDFGARSLNQLQLAGRLTPMDFLELAIRVSEALGQIHGEHIIHKDINPSNIVLNPETGQVKLIDLGISSALPRENPTFGNPNILEGTLAYLSPEQTGRMNRAVDYRTDFYSLGVTFYELLTGQLPFKSVSAMELMHAHIARQPCSPGELNPAVPRIVSQIILKLMAKNAEDRYQSAYGLKSDLEVALRQLQMEGDIRLVALGQRDVSDRFQIPQKLYGRENEIAVLLAACERVGAGASEMMLVSGHPGIGKSALIQEIYKPVTRQHGYFIAGKFDQVQRSIPYAALLQAFRSLLRQLLTEGETQVRVWREKLLAACAPNLQIIQEVIPEVERIVGSQPEAPTLPPTEAQNRFQWVFQNFIQVFAQADHPLVIFLDDLQWADGASLKLIAALMTAAQSHHVCLIAAYRGNETGADHPWLLTLQDLEKAGVVINRIGLGPLSAEQVSEWVADTLNCALEQARPLGELVWSKTDGNPFFVAEFLKFLHAHEWIVFDPAQGRWRWALSQIRAQQSTDNVVELLTARVRQLGQATQSVLELAACIGNQFDLDMLVVVGAEGKTRPETATDLWAALAEGLVLPLEETYPLMELDIQGLADQLTAEYKFAHDRIRQAAYSLIPEADRPAVHLRIGRRLLEKIPPAERDLRVFEIVNQLNQGRVLIQLPAERRQLAELNLRAGRKAKTSAAYEPALHYFQIGLELLERESWQTDYDQALALHVEAAEAAYLNADFNLMDQLIESVRQQARTPLDQGKVYEVLIHSHFVRNNLSEAVAAALRVLNLLGVRLPSKPNQLDIGLGLVGTFWSLGRKSPEDLAELPTMLEPHKQAAMRVMLSVIPVAYVAAPNLVPLFVFQMVRLSVSYGNTPASAFGYAAYGLILCGVVGQIETGYRFGRLALRLLERFNAQEFKAFTYVYANGFVFHWKDHFRETLRPLLEAYRSGLDHGDLNGAMLGALFYDYHAYLSGQELEVLAADMAAYSQMMQRFKQVTNFNYNELYRQAVLNLLGRNADPGRLVGESYDVDQMLPHHLAANERSIIFNVYFNQLILCYLFGAFRPALENADQTRKYLDGAVAALASGVFYFYDSLACLAVYAEAASAEQKQLLKRVAANQAKLQRWSQHAPMNYQHKFQLVEAELARVHGKEKEAREGYRQAIALARQNEFINEEALACELAARFYLAQEEPESAQSRLREAHSAYQRWGALGKLRDLETRYAALFQARPNPPDTSITATITVFGKPISFDLVSALKASYSLSSEISLDALLTKLMKIVIENAGAQAGYLLLPKEGAWVIEAEATTDGTGVSVLLSRPSSEARLPLAIIHYVAHTRESIVLDDAGREGMFVHDPEVIARRACSVLCAPLILKNDVTGILYLENNLAARAFTPDRLELLKLIASQAAISLENARLYAERRQAEETARANEQRFQNLFENAPLYICEVDITQTTAVVLQANRRLRQLYGWPEEAFALPPFEELIPPEALPGVTRLMQRVRAGQTVTIESVIRIGDGSLIPVRLTVAPEPDPTGVNRIISVMEDITAEKQRRSEAEAINEDRRRIAHEIHDGLAQNLLGLRMRAGLWHKLVETDPARLHTALDEMREILSASIDEVRRSIFALRPIELEAEGFFPTLRQFIAAAREQYRLEIALEIFGPEEQLPVSLELTLFRVIQEALNNVIKHAQASHVWIRLDLEKRDRLTLTLQDDGGGFDPTYLESASRDGHLGLKQMQERVEQAQGVLSIASRPGEGVMLQLTLPLIG